MQYSRPAHTKKIFLVYLKFKFIWASCVLSVNPSIREGRILSLTTHSARWVKSESALNSKQYTVQM